MTKLSNTINSSMMNGTSEKNENQRKALVDIKDLCVDYKSGTNITKAVKNVSLSIFDNQFTIIVGTSGCGKTSLLNCIGTMLTPTSGKVIYDGKNIGDFNDHEKTEYRKNIVGFVFQQYNLIADLTAEENIEVAACLAEDPSPAQDMLKVVGLVDKANNYPSQLSGGEQQRVCIARALAKNPKLLLCDEPTGALDVNNAIKVMTILQKLVKEHNVPVVMITHNPDFLSLADRYIVMSNGGIIEQINNLSPKRAQDLEIK